ncbi:MAG: hypothetical protein ACOYIQ_01995 [Christensenellales bacterium]|jgi:hypothetical protein
MANSRRVKCNTSGLLHNGRDNFCDRVVVNVTRVFDACIKQFAEENVTLKVVFSSYKPPYTFISGRSITTIMQNLTITPIEGSPCSRVKFDLIIPLAIVATNSLGVEVTGEASATASIDVVLRVPNDALTPAMIDCTATVVVLDGSFSSNNLRCTLCFTIINKVIANVDLILPTAGYPVIPSCEEFTEDVCSGVFSRPIYPVSR